MIAMALSLDPGLIVMDEPTTGLDGLVQERILRRIREIRGELKSSINLIAHDIAVIAEMSDRIAIMYGGEIMEEAPAVDRFERPHRPYTLGLKNAFPSIASVGGELISIPGAPPTRVGPVESCPFAPRRPFDVEDCRAANPAPEEIAPGPVVRCVRKGEAAEVRIRARKKSTWLSWSSTGSAGISR